MLDYLRRRATAGLRVLRENISKRTKHKHGRNIPVLQCESAYATNQSDAAVRICWIRGTDMWVKWPKLQKLGKDILHFSIPYYPIYSHVIGHTPTSTNDLRIVQVNNVQWYWQCAWYILWCSASMSPASASCTSVFCINCHYNLPFSEWQHTRMKIFLSSMKCLTKTPDSDGITYCLNWDVF